MLTEMLMLKLASLEAFVEAYENPEQDEKKYKELLAVKKEIREVLGEIQKKEELR
jgi:seryl-tRNA(Sec) selenium transferase